MKSYRTYILVIVVILFNTHLFSQGQSKGNGQNHPQENKSEDSRFSPEKMTQIVFYDTEEITKKIKLKDKGKKAQVSLAFEDFNDKMTEIKAFDSESLTFAKIYWEKKTKEAQQSGDRFILQEAQVRVKEMLAPLRKKITAQNILLDATLKKTLSEKQYDKWLKYQKSKLRPKTPSQSGQPQMQQRRGQGQGQGRRNY
ncbi:MAG: hypothetical protein HQ471_09040 [Flavobacteriales bacterium]|nr:hypothetical protein [Flavobacteriales bacterium]